MIYICYTCVTYVTFLNNSLYCNNVTYKLFIIRENKKRKERNIKREKREGGGVFCAACPYVHMRAHVRECTVVSFAIFLYNVDRTVYNASIEESGRISHLGRENAF